MKLKRLLTSILFFLLILPTQSFAETDPNKLHATRVFLLKHIAQVAVNEEGAVSEFLERVGYTEAVKAWLKCILASLAAKQFESENVRTILEVLRANTDVVDCLDSPQNILKAHKYKYIELSAQQVGVWNHIARHEVPLDRPGTAEVKVSSFYGIVSDFFSTGEIETDPNFWETFVGKAEEDPAELSAAIERYSRLLHEHPLLREGLNEVFFLRVLIFGYRRAVSDGSHREREYRDLTTMILNFFENSFKNQGGPWSLEEIYTEMLRILRHAEEIDSANELTYTNMTRDGRKISEHYDEMFAEGKQHMQPQRDMSTLQQTAAGVNPSGLTSVTLYMFSMMPFANIGLNLAASRPTILSGLFETMERDEVMRVIEAYRRERREWAQTMAEYMNPEKDESSQEWQAARGRINEGMNQYAHLGLRYMWSQIERCMAEDVPPDRRIKKVDDVWHNLPSFDFIENAVPLGFTSDGHLVVHNVFGETLVLQELRKAIEQPEVSVEYIIVSRTPRHEKITNVWTVVDGKVVLNVQALESMEIYNRIARGRERAAKSTGLARVRRAAEERSEKHGEGGEDKSEKEGPNWVAEQIQRLYERGPGDHRGKRGPEGHR